MQRRNSAVLALILIIGALCSLPAAACTREEVNGPIIKDNMP